MLNLISKADKEVKVKNKEIHILIIERGILGSQLIRRNDEISLLFEKIKLLKNTLNRGEKMYSVRLSDLKILKKEILRLRKINNNHNIEENFVSNLKNELRCSEKALLNERAKCQSLEELQCKLKTHKWREIEARDPTKYELIMKVKKLQKCLISKYEEITQLQLKFQEKDRIFFELKNYLAHRLNSQSSHMEERQAVDKKIRKLKVHHLKCHGLFVFKLILFLLFRVL